MRSSFCRPTILENAESTPCRSPNRVKAMRIDKSVRSVRAGLRHNPAQISGRNFTDPPFELETGAPAFFLFLLQSLEGRAELSEGPWPHPEVPGLCRRAPA